MRTALMAWTLELRTEPGTAQWGRMLNAQAGIIDDARKELAMLVELKSDLDRNGSIPKKISIQ